MVDTVRTLSELQTLLADNSAGNIGAQDMRDLLVSVYLNENHSNIENGKTTVDTPDDEFNSGTLDAKWNVVQGSTGTVDLLETGTSAVYDLSTQSGTLLTQTDTSSGVRFRQDYTLPDGNSIVFAFSPTVVSDAGVSNNEKLVGVSVNSSSVDPLGGGSNSSQVLLDCDTSATLITNQSSSTRYGRTRGSHPMGTRIYGRICRDGLTYRTFYSHDGECWCSIGNQTSGSAHDYIWIMDVSLVTPGNPTPIQHFHWVRQGSNNLQPW